MVCTAERTGRIRYGDRIISANDKDLTKLSRKEVGTQKPPNVQIG
jgi:hypothetical protein